MSHKHASGLTRQILGGNPWLVLAVLYFLSGFTSLSFEVLWARMLSLQFGVSIFGVVLAVAAFMIGLGSGSLLGVRWEPRCRMPLARFGLLEGAVASYALMLPIMLHAANVWLGGVAAKLPLAQWYLLQAVAGLCLLTIPAFAMGMGFPLFLKAVQQTPLSLGKLYGINTIGGVAGALFPLWGLPGLGWTSAVRATAFVGLLVAITAYYLSHSTRSPSDTRQSALNTSSSRPNVTSLIIYAGIGAGSIMLEIGWIRLFGMVMLRTEYVLGVILAVFLVGIAIGSIVFPRAYTPWLTVLLPLTIGSGVLLGLYFLPAVSAWVENSNFESFAGLLWSQALLLVLLTLPVTLALGAWLPLLASRLCTAQTGGIWLYGANCLGGGAGAIIASLVCMPHIGSAAMVALAGLVITALGLVWARVRWSWLAFSVLVMLAWPLRNMPPINELLPGIEGNSRDLFLYEDAISLTEVIQQHDGQRVLLSDLQRMDASSEPSAVRIQMDQARLPLLLHPWPRSVLFLGLGTGISAAGSLNFPDLQRTAVELSQGSIYAAKDWFASVNGDISEKIQIQRDDARHFLTASARTYDVIIGDLFHPDLVGMGSLLSIQQFQRARDHLSNDGIFVQWLALNQFDLLSLQAVLRGFKQAFPEAVLFMDGLHLALVGPKQKVSAQAMLENLQRLTMLQQDGATGGEGAWTWLGRYWGRVPEGEGPVQDEWMPYIEFRLPRVRHEGARDLSGLLTWLLRNRPDVDAAMRELGIESTNKSKFGRAYLATELDVRAWGYLIQGNAEKAGALVWMAYQGNPQDRWIANALADNMLQSLSQASQHGLTKQQALQRILAVAPDSVGALHEMWLLERSEGNMKVAEQYRKRLLELSPLDAEAIGSR